MSLNSPKKLPSRWRRQTDYLTLTGKETQIQVFSICSVIYLVMEVSFRYDHPHILSGQGTLGLEIVEEVPDLEAVVIPVGGGGLLAGVAVAVKGLRPDVQIIVRENY